MIDDWSAVPAFLRDRHLTVIAANPLAMAVSPSFRPGLNLARSTFIDSAFERDAPCWPEVTGQVAAMLRDSLEQHDEDSRFRDIVGELSTRSSDFATAWAGEERPLTTGTAEFRLEGIGLLSLSYRQLWVAEDHDDVLMVWRARDAASRRGLARLARRVERA